MNVAPPTVPGMPPANSSPENPSLEQRTPRRLNGKALPTRYVPGSTTSTAECSSLLSITKPSNPRSSNKQLEPLPTIKKGIDLALQYLHESQDNYYRNVSLQGVRRNAEVKNLMAETRWEGRETSRK